MKFTAVVCVLAVAAAVSAAKIQWPLPMIESRARANSVVYHPPPMPCSFKNIINIVTYYESSVSKGTYIIAKDDNVLAIKLDQSDDSHLMTAYRSDETFERDGQIYAPIHSAYSLSRCVCEEVLLKEMIEDVHKSVSPWYDDAIFDYVNESLFMGKKCKVYHKSLGDSVMEYFADYEGGWLIGIYQSGHDYETTAEIIYKSSPANTDLFVFDNTVFPDCDKRAYQELDEQCPEPGF